MQPARPAQALVRFESKVANGVVLYGGDQVKAGKVLFTLTQDATIWPLDCVTVARRSLLSDEDLADATKVRGFIDGLDTELGAAVQGSVDAVRLAVGADQQVAPYDVLTLASDGLSAPVDFSATVDACVWIGVLKNAGVIGDPLVGPQTPSPAERCRCRSVLRRRPGIPTSTRWPPAAPATARR
jgi:hypothetical protein